MKRLITSLAAAGLLLLSMSMAMPIAVQAAGPDCSSGDIEVKWWANGGYDDNGVGVAQNIRCTNAAAGKGILDGTLNSCQVYPYDYQFCGNPALEEKCPTSHITSGSTWNDCISSFKAWTTTCHYGIRWYHDGWLGGTSWSYWPPTTGNQVNVSSLGGANDEFSSYKTSSWGFAT